MAMTKSFWKTMKKVYLWEVKQVMVMNSALAQKKTALAQKKTDPRKMILLSKTTLTQQTKRV
jgi:hypothetical protein